jgi:HK97 gp10 family phage protein
VPGADAGANELSENFVTVKFTGGDELQKTLETLPINIARRLLREAILKAVEIWKEEIELRAPSLEQVKLALKSRYVRIPGDLSRHIVVKVTANSDLEALAQVGPSRRTFWGIFFEFGTHKMSARPFIVPAYESKKQAVLDKFVEEGRQIVTEEASKHV